MRGPAATQAIVISKSLKLPKERGEAGVYRIVKRKKWPEKVGRREISGRKCREEGNLPSCTSPLPKDDRTDTNFIALFKMHF